VAVCVVGYATVQDVKRLTLDVDETARALGLSRNSTYDAIRRGEIPSLRINGRILVPVVALARLLKPSGGAAVESDADAARELVALLGNGRAGRIRGRAR
jgi:excisionase family DNA binding protein